MNPHARKGHCALNAARLPFRHFGPKVVLSAVGWWAVLDLNQ